MKLKTSNQIKLETAIFAAREFAELKAFEALKETQTTQDTVDPREVARRIERWYLLADEIGSLVLELTRD
jgi:hypothetical protein